MAQNVVFRHAAPLSWNTRGAPIHNGGGLGSAATWRERAALHRTELGFQIVKSGQSELRKVAGSSRQKDTGARELTQNKYAAHKPAVEDVPAVDLCIIDTLATVEVEDDGVNEDCPNEDYLNDWWGRAMRVDLESYVAFKNAQFRTMVRESTSIASVFDSTAAWSIVSEIISWERSVLRRHKRGQKWPDAMRSPAYMSRDQIEELKSRIRQWSQRFEDLDGCYGAREALRILPVDIALQQLLADALVAADKSHEARWALLLAIGAASPEKEPERAVGKAQFAPPRIGWDGHCDCDYIKAQQCTRFARLAVMTAKALDSTPDGQEYTPELCRLRAHQRRCALSEELVISRRQLTDARRLFKSELSALEKLIHEQARSNGSCGWGVPEAFNFRLAIRCAYLGATALLATTYSMQGQQAEACAMYNEAIRDLSDLLNDDYATPQLKKLLNAEKNKLAYDLRLIANKPT